MLIEYLNLDFQFENENGMLVQLVHEGWKQVNVICSPSNSIRGGHYHKYNQEAFYVVSGSFQLQVWNSNVRETYAMKSGDFFMLNPGVFHTFLYNTDTVLVSLYSKGVELSDTEKDIWTN